ncbi:hypothetical protein M885DRAFT_560926, partial [Pelagophyceae sp. CCMP2097]
MARLVDCSTPPSRVHPVAAPLPLCWVTDTEAPCAAAAALPEATMTRVPEAKRRAPAEPPVLIQYAREREVESLVEAGKLAAERVILNAGFLGGQSTYLLVFWIFSGIFYGVVAVAFLVQAHGKRLSFLPTFNSKGCQLSVLESMLYMLHYAALSCGFLQRAWYLRAQQPVKALVFLGVGVTRSAKIRLICFLAFPHLGKRCKGENFPVLKPIFLANYIVAYLHVWYVGNLMQSKKTRRASAQLYWLRVHFVELFFSMSLARFLDDDNVGGVWFALGSLSVIIVHAWFWRTLQHRNKEANKNVMEDVKKYEAVWKEMKPQQGDRVWKSIRDELKDLETGEYTAKEPHHNLVRD